MLPFPHQPSHLISHFLHFYVRVIGRCACRIGLNSQKMLYTDCRIYMWTVLAFFVVVPAPLNEPSANECGTHMIHATNSSVSLSIQSIDYGFHERFFRGISPPRRTFFASATYWGIGKTKSVYRQTKTDYVLFVNIIISELLLLFAIHPTINCR